MIAADFAVGMAAQAVESFTEHVLRWPEGLGFLGNFVALFAYFRKTMIPLRIIAIASNVLLIVFGVVASSYPTLTANLILLPLNIGRLWEMRRLVKRVETAASDDFSLDWLVPFMHKDRIASGTVVFRKGDEATNLLLIVSGWFLLEEAGVEIKPGEVLGELGMLSPGRRRTQTLRCLQTGEVRSISYDEVEQLYFQNPEFGFYFLRLASRRLFFDIERMEQQMARQLAKREPAPAAVGGAVAS